MSFSPEHITRLIAKDSEAFSEFYEYTLDHFARFLKGRYSLSQAQQHDIIHDFYVKLRRVIDQYNPDYSFETWYWTVFRNLIKDSFKSSYREINDDEIISELGEENTLLDHLTQDCQHDAIMDAVERLDEVNYTIVTLRYLEQKEYHEIAAIVKMTESTVRKRLSRALTAIKKDIYNDYR